MQTILSINFILLFLFSCSGYRIKGNNNPFAEYGVERLTIPMFVNRSVFANASGVFTRDINLLLGQYRNLRVYSGETPRADGVLIGIISSQDRKRDAIKTISREFTEDVVGASLTNNLGQSRPDFYVPRVNEVSLSLELILIKRPTLKEIELMKSGVGDFINNHPKIAFRKKFDIKENYTLEVNSTSNVDLGGIANNTKNKQILNRAINRVSLSAVRRFKEEVLDAF